MENKHSAAVERTSTCWFKSTYTNTHGSSSTSSKPNEERRVKSSDFKSFYKSLKVWKSTFPKAVKCEYSDWIDEW